MTAEVVASGVAGTAAGLGGYGPPGAANRVRASGLGCAGIMPAVAVACGACRAGVKGACRVVRLPVSSHEALAVQQTAIRTEGGIDFVVTEAPEGPVMRSVVPGMRFVEDGTALVEILSGLRPGDRVRTVASQAGAQDE